MDHHATPAISQRSPKCMSRNRPAARASTICCSRGTARSKLSAAKLPFAGFITYNKAFRNLPGSLCCKPDIRPRQSLWRPLHQHRPMDDRYSSLCRISITKSSAAFLCHKWGRYTQRGSHHLHQPYMTATPTQTVPDFSKCDSVASWSVSALLANARSGSSLQG